MSRGEGNANAFNLIDDVNSTLGEILAVTYFDSSDLIYRWSYLVVYYMFEFRPEWVDRMLEYTRVGDYDSYQNHVDDFERLEEDGFAAWLQDPRGDDGYCSLAPNLRQYAYIS